MPYALIGNLSSRQRKVEQEVEKMPTSQFTGFPSGETSAFQGRLLGGVSPANVLWGVITQSIVISLNVHGHKIQSLTWAILHKR